MAKEQQMVEGWLWRLFGWHRHEWGDDQDFVSCSIVTISSDPDVQPTSRPRTIQTLQWCLICDKERRKPGSARPARAHLDPSSGKV